MPWHVTVTIIVSVLAAIVFLACSIFEIYRFICLRRMRKRYDPYQCLYETNNEPIPVEKGDKKDEKPPVGDSMESSFTVSTTTSGTKKPTTSRQNAASKVGYIRYPDFDALYQETAMQEGYSPLTVSGNWREQEMIRVVESSLPRIIACDLNPRHPDSVGCRYCSNRVHLDLGKEFANYQHPYIPSMIDASPCNLLHSPRDPEMVDQFGNYYSSSPNDVAKRNDSLQCNSRTQFTKEQYVQSPARCSCSCIQCINLSNRQALYNVESNVSNQDCGGTSGPQTVDLGVHPPDPGNRIPSASSLQPPSADVTAWNGEKKTEEGRVEIIKVSINMNSDKISKNVNDEESAYEPVKVANVAALQETSTKTAESNNRSDNNEISHEDAPNIRPTASAGNENASGTVSKLAGVSKCADDPRKHAPSRMAKNESGEPVAKGRSEPNDSKNTKGNSGERRPSRIARPIARMAGTIKRSKLDLQADKYQPSKSPSLLRD